MGGCLSWKKTQWRWPPVETTLYVSRQFSPLAWSGSRLLGPACVRQTKPQDPPLFVPASEYICLRRCSISFHAIGKANAIYLGEAWLRTARMTAQQRRSSLSAGGCSPPGSKMLMEHPADSACGRTPSPAGLARSVLPADSLQSNEMGRVSSGSTWSQR